MTTQGEHHDGPGVTTRARKAYRMYSWTRWVRRLWLWLTAAGPANTVAGVGVVTVVAAAGGLLVSDVVEDRRAAERLRLTVAAATAAPRLQLGREATFYAIQGRDRAGRLAEFDLIVLADDFHWVRGRSDQMERGGQVLSGSDLQRLLTERDLGERLQSAVALIAVGLASSEGERAAEEARANARGGMIAKALIEATRGSKPVWVLDLGQHLGRAGGPSDTDWQRPILIAGLRRSDAGAELGEAFAAALNGAPNLPKTSSYSRFDVRRADTR